MPRSKSRLACRAYTADVKRRKEGRRTGPGKKCGASSSTTTSTMASTSSPFWTFGSPSSSSEIQGAEALEDQRFAELLRPIKDLTENWEVPLSRYLEDYIEELSGRTAATMIGGGRVNFVEAALLLQGTAHIYSKKVDFLYQTVFKMADLLSSHRARNSVERGRGLDDDEDEDDVRASGKSTRRKLHDEIDAFTFVRPRISKHINLKDEGVKTRSHSNNNNLISVTPRQLIEREGQNDMRNVRINLYSVGKNVEMLGHKEDFRINGQFCTQNATVGEELSSDLELTRLSVSLCEGDSIFGDDSQDEEEEDKEGHDDDFNDVSIGDLFNDDVLNDDRIELELPVVVVADAPPVEGGNEEEDLDRLLMPPPPTPPPQRRRSERCNKRLSIFEERLAEPKAPLADPWLPINPHEMTENASSAPLRKGKTCRAPPGIALKTGKKRKRTTTKEDAIVPPIEQYLVKKIPALRGNRLGGGEGAASWLAAHKISAEFVNLAAKEAEEAKKRRERERREAKKKTTAAAAEVLEKENVDGEEEEGDLFQGGLDDDGDDDNVPDPRLDDDIDLANAMLPPSLLNEEMDDDEGGAGGDSTPDSYEDLVIKRVAAYVQQSQAYLESTDLAKRVAKWHEHIRPRLEAVERRNDFDIHEYGSRILSAFPREDDGQTTATAKTVQFSEFVGGMEREEVCRYFLSSLMLANTYNIGLETGGLGEEMPMDRVEMTLLSRHLHHQQFMEVGRGLVNGRKRKRKRREDDDEEDLFPVDDKDSSSSSSSSSE